MSDGQSIFIVTMKITKKRRHQQRLEVKRPSDLLEKGSPALTIPAQSMKPQAIEKLIKEKKQLMRADAAADKWKEEAEKRLAEAQAREEEALRRLNAGRGRDGRRANRGGRREYPGGRGGMRGGRPGDHPGRGLPPTEEESRPSEAPKEGDQDTYKVCQFYLHEFKTQPQAPKPQGRTVNENSEIIAEIEQAFCGFFDASECDMAYKDHNMDVCEAAYQLACDAVENRYKLTLPLDRSVLLCESHVTHETSSKKGSNECEVQVRKDSILAPSSLY